MRFLYITNNIKLLIRLNTTGTRFFNLIFEEYIQEYNICIISTDLLPFATVSLSPDTPSNSSHIYYCCHIHKSAHTHTSTHTKKSKPGSSSSDWREEEANARGCSKKTGEARTLNINVFNSLVKRHGLNK